MAFELTGIRHPTDSTPPAGAAALGTWSGDWEYFDEGFVEAAGEPGYLAYANWSDMMVDVAEVLIPALVDTLYVTPTGPTITTEPGGFEFFGYGQANGSTAFPATFTRLNEAEVGADTFFSTPLDLSATNADFTTYWVDEDTGFLGIRTGQINFDTQVVTIISDDLFDTVGLFAITAEDFLETVIETESGVGGTFEGQSLPTNRAFTKFDLFLVSGLEVYFDHDAATSGPSPLLNTTGFPDDYDFLPYAMFVSHEGLGLNGSAGMVENPTDPDGIPPIILDDSPVSPIADLLWITEGGLVGGVLNPALPAGFKILNRSSDITGVINGFMTIMEDALPLFVDKEGFSEMQDSADANHNKMVGLADGTAVNDVVTKAQLDAQL